MRDKAPKPWNQQLLLYSAPIVIGAKNSPLMTCILYIAWSHAIIGKQLLVAHLLSAEKTLIPNKDFTNHFAVFEMTPCFAYLQ